MSSTITVYLRNGLGDIIQSNESRINNLLKQLSLGAETLTRADIERMIAQEDFFMFGAFIEHSKTDLELVGIATIFFRETPMHYAGYIEDVVVDKDCRKGGVGTLLGKAIIDLAKEKRVSVINLRSGNQRLAAHALWKKLGFQEKDSKSFVLHLK